MIDLFGQDAPRNRYGGGTQPDAALVWDAEIGPGAPVCCSPVYMLCQVEVGRALGAVPAATPCRPPGRYGEPLPPTPPRLWHPLLQISGLLKTERQLLLDTGG